MIGVNYVLKQEWSNSLDFWIGTLGFAIGFGGFWRLPYAIFAHGGGAFFIPYFICYMIFAYPLFYWESALGQIYRSNAIISFASLDKRLKGIGYAQCVMTIIVASTYVYLITYSMIFMMDCFSFPLPWRDDNMTALNTTEGLHQTHFYKDVLQISSDLREPGGINPSVFWVNALTLFLCFVTISFGLNFSGKISYATSIAPFILLGIFFVRGCFLDGWWEGLGFLVSIDYLALFDPILWFEAAAQAIFQVSIGLSAVIQLSSYRKRHEDIGRSSFWICMLNLFTGVFSSIIVFGFMGYVAKTADTKLEDIPLRGFDLVFIAYPQALLRMPQAGLWTFLLYLMLFLIGFQSEFILLESITAYFIEANIKFKNIYLKPLHIRILVVLACFILGLILSTRGGFYYFEIFDRYGVVTNIITVATIELVVMGWHPAVVQLQNLVLGFTGEGATQYLKKVTKYYGAIGGLILSLGAGMSFLVSVFRLPVWLFFVSVGFTVGPLALVGYFYYERPKKARSSEQPLLLEMKGEHSYSF